MSVIVVLYNQAGLTMQCLQSLSRSTGVVFETIVVDNASSDAMPDELQRVDGARLLVQTENLGFPTGGESGGGLRKGAVRSALNNDAMVEPTTLASACARLAAEPRCRCRRRPYSFVGWQLHGKPAASSGTTVAVSRATGAAMHPSCPNTSFVRDVDYCSCPSCWCVGRCFEQLDRFDEVSHRPTMRKATSARLWEHGHRVVYDPAVRIRHFEFASDVNSGQAMALQARNRAIFVERHREFLASNTHPGRTTSRERRANWCPRGANAFLIIDDRVPYPSLGRGYPRACMIANLVSQSAGSLTYYPLQTPQDDWSKVYTALPERTEIVLNQGLPGLSDFLERYAAGFRHHHRQPPAQHGSPLRPSGASIRIGFAGATIAYDAEALFSLREIERAKVMKSKL